MNTVIFDMDGVIVDTEPFWQSAEKEVFSALGVVMTDELCQRTQRMTTEEVTNFWYQRNPWKDEALTTVENRVIDQVIASIETEDCIIPGVVDTIKGLRTRGFQLGLATNSPYRIIPKVLQKTKLTHDFAVISAAEFERKGKPAPDIYLSTLHKLKTKAEHCIVVEDSNSGIIAAKQAGLKVIAFTNQGQNLITEKVAYQLASFEQIDYAIFTNNK